MQRFQFVPLSALLLISGCTGIAVKQDYDTTVDLSALKSFGWQSATQKPGGNELVDNTLIDSRIRTAVEKELLAKGHRKAGAAQPDYLVAYSYTIQNRIERDTHGSSVGVGVGKSTRGSFGSIGFNFGTSERDYEQGTLIIDVISPATGKLLWRGFARQRLVWQTDPDKTTARINEVVAAIAKKFPPPQKR